VEVYQHLLGRTGEIKLTLLYNTHSLYLRCD